MNRQAGEAQLPTLWLDCSTTPQASSRWGILVSAILLVAFIKHIAVSVRLRVHCSIGVLGEKMALGRFFPTCDIETAKFQAEPSSLVQELIHIQGFACGI